MAARSSDGTAAVSEMPLVTFAVIAYNQENFIREAVEAAFAQTYSPLEIILSDDCSSDSTFAVIQELARLYYGPHRVIVNRNEHNLGIGGHVNRIVELSSGRLNVMAAGDDISLASRCASLVDCWICQQRPMMLMSDWQVIDEAGRTLDAHKQLTNADLDLSSVDKRMQFLLSCLTSGEPLPLHGATAAYSRELFDSFGTLSCDVVAEDYALFLRSLLIGAVGYIGIPLVRYRKHRNNLSRVEATGPEKIRRGLARNVPSYENLWKDLQSLRPSPEMSEAHLANLTTQLRRFLKSARLVRDWPKTKWPVRYFYSFVYILLFGARRHRKWMYRGLLKRTGARNL